MGERAQRDGGKGREKQPLRDRECGFCDRERGMTEEKTSRVQWAVCVCVWPAGSLCALHCVMLASRPAGVVLVPSH